MAVVSSSILSASVQVDGRTQVREYHLSDDGRTWTIDYMAEVGADLEVTLRDRAALLSALPVEQAPTYQPMLLRKQIIDRMSDEELTIAMAAFEVPANLRLKAMWYAAVVIDPTDVTVIGALTTLFGSTRATELLQVG